MTIGNTIGGSMMVAAVYWLVYLRKKTTVSDYYSLIAIRH
jgi:formate/nitrite transporter FocA (FNT family)